VEEYLGHRDSMDAIDKEELLHRIEVGTAVVIDARPSVEYSQGHISGALSIPVDELAQRLKELPKNREVVAYCREELAAYKVPRIVEFRSELPKSLIGKVLRRELREDNLNETEEYTPA